MTIFSIIISALIVVFLVGGTLLFGIFAIDAVEEVTQSHNSKKAGTPTSRPKMA